MNQFTFIVAISFFVISCEKEIPLKQDEIQPRIVVNGIFVAGDTIRIQVSESRDVLYDDVLPEITSATAGLYDSNDNLLGNFIHEGNGVYAVTSYIPVAGQTYKIKVVNAGFDDVTAQSYAPEILAISSVDTNVESSIVNYEIKFNDNALEKNYYALTINKIEAYIDYITGDISLNENPYFSTKELFTQNGQADIDGTKWGTIFLFSDASFNGGQCSFTAQNDFDTFADTVLMAIGLRSISEDYYKYSLTLAKYQETAGDPFSQPVQVYSNIENGFGIFGGYSAYSDTLIVQ